MTSVPETVAQKAVERDELARLPEVDAFLIGDFQSGQEMRVSLLDKPGVAAFANNAALDFFISIKCQTPIHVPARGTTDRPW